MPKHNKNKAKRSSWFLALDTLKEKPLKDVFYKFSHPRDITPSTFIGHTDIQDHDTFATLYEDILAAFVTPSQSDETLRRVGVHLSKQWKEWEQGAEAAQFWNRRRSRKHQAKMWAHLEHQQDHLLEFQTADLKSSCTMPRTTLTHPLTALDATSITCTNPLPSSSLKTCAKLAKDTSISSTAVIIAEPMTSMKDLRRPSTSSQTTTAFNFQIDPMAFEREHYHLNSEDIGQIFYDFQCEAASLVNRVSAKATVHNIHHFLAINYIFDLTVAAPQGMNPDTFETIKRNCSIEHVELPDDQGILCLKLGREVARTGMVMPRLFDDPGKMSILFLFQILVTQLVRKAMPSDKEYEDTFAHTTFDPFWTCVFHRDSAYTFGWANEVDQGSRTRRSDGYKPDGYLKKMHACVCVVEIKSPRQAHTATKRSLKTTGNLQICARTILTTIIEMVAKFLDGIEIILTTPPCKGERDTFGKPSLLTPSRRPFF
ncbi:hypothetical protein BGX28_009961 [Mortierella sp. GBA30]|nr:hypothetical protein BGX28_009961 [Mortierella sp. GBA30]